MPLDPRGATDYAWVCIGLLWVAMAFTTKRTARRISRGALLLHMLVLTLGAELIFGRYFRVAFLRERFVPPDEWIAWTGFAAALAGFAFAAWARFRLGRNWSGEVTLKEGHALVRGGPYELVRHPIYTGLSLALLATAVVYGEVRCLLGAVLIFFEWKRKSLMEERFLVEHFGRDYLQYRHEVKSLIPFLW